MANVQGFGVGQHDVAENKKAFQKFRPAQTWTKLIAHQNCKLRTMRRKHQRNHKFRAIKTKHWRNRKFRTIKTKHQRRDQKDTIRTKKTLARITVVPLTAASRRNQSSNRNPMQAYSSHMARAAWIAKKRISSGGRGTLFTVKHWGSSTRPSPARADTFTVERAGPGSLDRYCVSPAAAAAPRRIRREGSSTHPHHPTRYAH